MTTWPSGQSVKYLGVHINMKLDWRDHWNYVKGMIKADMNIVNKRTISAAEARYIINTKIGGTLMYSFQHIPFKDKDLEEMQQTFNSSIRAKVGLGGGVCNEMLMLDSDRLGLGLLDVKGMYYATKLTELYVKLNDQSVVGRMARHGLSKLQDKWRCEVQPLQYEELNEYRLYSEKNRGANKYYMEAAHAAALKTGVRIVSSASEHRNARQTIMEAVDSIKHDDWTTLKPQIESNGLVYIDEITTYDEQMEKWKMKDWGKLRLTNARQQTQDTGWWSKLCGILCGGSDEAIRHNIVTKVGLMDRRGYILPTEKVDMSSLMPSEIGGGEECVNASDGSATGQGTPEAKAGYGVFVAKGPAIGDRERFGRLPSGTGHDNYEAELMGIREGVRMNPLSTKVTHWTDSESAMKVLERWPMLTHRQKCMTTHGDIIEAIYQGVARRAEHGGCYKVRWVKAHQDDDIAYEDLSEEAKWNVKADALADRGREEEEVREEWFGPGSGEYVMIGGGVRVCGNVRAHVKEKRKIEMWEE